jgi:phosphoribosylanthranilate isomerase
VGSTGETLDPAVVASLAESISKPFLLAGGLSDDNRGDYDELTRHPHFMGIDVDTNARGADGKVSGDRVEAILGAWQHA